MTRGSPVMDITVIICTRNRAASLDRALLSATRLRVPQGLAWEVIVVDNGSSDSTPAVVASFADRLPIRHVLEPVAGLSNARNRGVAEAQGALICWTDDDVELDPEWLAAYRDAAAAFPEAAFFGGNITPVLEGPTPAWFLRMVNEPELQNLIAARSFSGVPVPLTSHDGLIPYGANFAIRSSDQKRHRYDSELGVSPQHRRLGEETQLVLAIIAAGGTGWTVPPSNVRHIIPAARQTRRYLWSYNLAVGETRALLRGRTPETAITGRRQLFGMPLWVVRVAATHWCLSIMARMKGHDGDWLRNSSEAAQQWGVAVYLMKSRKRGER